jgi:hypothetical protein
MSAKEIDYNDVRKWRKTSEFARKISTTWDIIEIPKFDLWNWQDNWLYMF